MDEPGKSALYLVPTPVGNMEDITQRALNVLRRADIIACEDTRRTGKLLQMLGIENKKMISYHEHNEKERSSQLVNEIKSGQNIALTTDAGTPAISDPGYRLVNAAIEENIEIISLPGATAFVPALAASGLPVHNFLFMGFPPLKKGRKTFFEKIAKEPYTVILYESPYRIEKIVKEIAEYCGADRNICLAREISKIHEEYIRGTADEVLEEIKKRKSLKGEFVVLIEGIK